MKQINRNTLVLMLILATLGTLLYVADVRPFKILVVLMLALIFSALVSGFYHLVSKNGNSDSLLRSLTWRISLSVLLFITLMLSAHFGLIDPGKSAMHKIEKEVARHSNEREKSGKNTDTKK